MQLMALLFLGVFAESATVTVNTTGVYDENINRPNTVDSSLTPSTSVGTSLDVSTFTSLVSTAQSSQLGGVINFDSTPSGTLNANDILRATVVSGKTVDFTMSSGGRYAFGLGGANPTSGNAFGYGAFAGGINDAAAADIDFTIGGLSGFDSGAFVSSIGFTFLGRTNGGSLTNASNVSFNIFYSGGGFDAFSTNANNVGGERFIGATAPTGQSITRVQFVSGITNRQLFIDDLGFVIAIPEPSTYFMMGFGLFAILVLGNRSYRKQRRS